MALWVDRHLHKNGGSTIREVMLRNEEAGKCVYYGYTQTREGWDRLMSYLRTVNGTDIEAAALPKVCVEAHASQASAEFTSRRIPDLLELRSLYARLRVPLKVVLTVRGYVVWQELRVAPEPWGRVAADRYLWATMWAEVMLPLVACAASGYLYRGDARKWSSAKDEERYCT